MEIPMSRQGSANKSHERIDWLVRAGLWKITAETKKSAAGCGLNGAESFNCWGWEEGTERKLCECGGRAGLDQI